jgi:hypothetical protein
MPGQGQAPEGVLALKEEIRARVAMTPPRPAKPEMPGAPGGRGGKGSNIAALASAEGAYLDASEALRYAEAAWEYAKEVVASSGGLDFRLLKDLEAREEALEEARSRYGAAAEAWQAGIRAAGAGSQWEERLREEKERRNTAFWREMDRERKKLLTKPRYQEWSAGDTSIRRSRDARDTGTTVRAGAGRLGGKASPDLVKAARDLGKQAQDAAKAVEKAGKKAKDASKYGSREEAAYWAAAAIEAANRADQIATRAREALAKAEKDAAARRGGKGGTGRPPGDGGGGAPGKSVPNDPDVPPAEPVATPPPTGIYPACGNPVIECADVDLDCPPLTFVACHFEPGEFLGPTPVGPKVPSRGGAGEEAHPPDSEGTAESGTRPVSSPSRRPGAGPGGEERPADSPRVVDDHGVRRALVYTGDRPRVFARRIRHGPYAGWLLAENRDTKQLVLLPPHIAVAISQDVQFEVDESGELVAHFGRPDMDEFANLLRQSLVEANGPDYDLNLADERALLETFVISKEDAEGLLRQEKLEHLKEEGLPVLKTALYLTPVLGQVLAGAELAAELGKAFGEVIRGERSLKDALERVAIEVLKAVVLRKLGKVAGRLLGGKAKAVARTAGRPPVPALRPPRAPKAPVRVRQELRPEASTPAETPGAAPPAGAAVPRAPSPLPALPRSPGRGGRPAPAELAPPGARAGKSSGVAPPEQGPFDPRSVGAARLWTTSGRLKNAQLPTRGLYRYVPPKNYHPSRHLPRGPRGGFLDSRGNEWLKGRPTPRDPHPREWDVQLGRNATPGFRALSPDGKHVNVGFDGRITHGGGR